MLRLYKNNKDKFHFLILILILTAFSLCVTKILCGHIGENVIIYSSVLFSIFGITATTATGLFALLGFVGTHKLSIMDIETSQVSNIIKSYLPYFERLHTINTGLAGTINCCKKIEKKEDLIEESSDREFNMFKESCQKLQDIKDERKIIYNDVLYFSFETMILILLSIYFLLLLSINPILFESYLGFSILVIIVMLLLHSLGIAFLLIKSTLIFNNKRKN